MNYDELLQHYKDQFEKSFHLRMYDFLRYRSEISVGMKRDLLKHAGEDKFFVVLRNGKIARKVGDEQ